MGLDSVKKNSRTKRFIENALYLQKMGNTKII